MSKYRNDSIGPIGCVLLVVALIAFVGLVMAATAFILMVAWNALLPSLLGWPVLAYGQALAATAILWIVGGAFKTTVSSSN